jgi:hypothetical protein
LYVGTSAVFEHTESSKLFAFIELEPLNKDTLERQLDFRELKLASKEAEFKTFNDSSDDEADDADKKVQQIFWSPSRPSDVEDRSRCYIQNFCDFGQFWAKKLAFFEKKQCYYQIFAKASSSLSEKRHL